MRCIGGLLLTCALFVGMVVFLVPLYTPEGLTFLGMPLPMQTRWSYREFLEEQALLIARRPLQPTSSHLEQVPDPRTPAELGVELDVERTFLQTPFESLLSRWFRREPMKERVRPVWRFVPRDFSSLEEFVYRHQLPPRPARVIYDNGRVRVEEGRTGVRLKTERVISEVAMALEEGKTSFELPLEKNLPTVSEESLQQITGIVAEFSTRFNPRDRNRTENICLAAQSLNGALILPGGRLSFNKVVGERTAKNGYKLATIFRRGKEALGVGGGVCQVSGTLFNAALLANLRILQRQNHSKVVAYLPGGRDATVDFGIVDLVIENTHPYPVAILTEVRDGTTWVGIAGKPDPNLKVDVVTTLTATWSPPLRYVEDNTLPIGKTRVVEKGRWGRKYATWRIIRYNGEIILRERVAESTYPAFPRVVAVGTMVGGG